MRQLKIGLVYAIMLIIAVPLALCAQGFGSKDHVGKVIAKAQSVHVFRGNEKLVVGNFGLSLKQGDIVVTETDGKAQITLTNGTKLAVAPSTKLEISAEVMNGDKVPMVYSVVHLIYGKIRAQVQKTRQRHIQLRTATAVIGVKGTDFVAEYKDEITNVGTVEGLVYLASVKTSQEIDIPPGKMSSVSAAGELMPLSEFAGELMEGVEFAGKVMREDEISGEKIEM